jgi:hypothetical protein
MSEIVKYQEKLNGYIAKIMSNNYSIQLLISKCCGYSFLIHISTHATLEDLYKLVSHEMENGGHNLLYYNKPYNKNNLIPRSTYNFKDYIKSLNLQPHFQMPAPVVYLLWLDDGNHGENCNH